MDSKENKLVEIGEKTMHLDKVELLRRLWEISPVQNYSAYYYPGKPMKWNDNWRGPTPEEEVKGYIYHYRSRPIRCDLSGDYANSTGYNSVVGIGTFESVVQIMKKEALYVKKEAQN